MKIGDRLRKIYEECPKDYPQGIATVKQFVEQLLRRGQARNTAIPCFQDDPSSWRLGKPTRLSF
jgi:hypothetical protein